jgi:hypothetical protein
MSRSLLAYHEETAQLVNDLRDDKLRIAAEVEMDLEPCTDQIDIPGSDKAGLLMPPWIETLLPEFYLRGDGEIEGIIHILTSDLFGIASMAVAIKDQAGNLLERGEAMRDETCLGYWVYLPDLTPPVGTCLIIRAVAKDALGGLNIAEETVTLTEEYLEETTDQLE